MKDAYYFPHDSNARYDPRIIALCSKFGLVAYAYYFQLIEILREQNNYELDESLESVIANAWQSYGNAIATKETPHIMELMITLKLIEKKDGKISSPSLIKRMAVVDELRRKRSESGKIGAMAKWQTDGKPMAVKERKVIKEKNKDIVDVRPPASKRPSLKDVEAYCLERQNAVDPEKWLSYYEANGWRVGRNPMKDWKAAVRTWERNGFIDSKPTQKREVIG